MKLGKLTSCIVAVLGMTIAALPQAHASVVQSAPDIVGIDENGGLYRISTADASYSLIAQTDISGMGSLTFHDGALYGITEGFTPELFKLSPDGTILDSHPVDVFFVSIEGALTVAPDGTAYGVNGNMASNLVLFTIDLATGNVITNVETNLPRDINGLEWRSDPGRGEVGGTLVGIESLSNSIVTVDPTTGATSGLTTLTAPLGGVGGMVIDPLSGAAFFSTAAPDSPPAWEDGGSNELYSFDPMTGNHSLVGTLHAVDAGVPPVEIKGFTGLAIVPEPATLLLLGLGGVMALRRRR